jgi:hydrogenase maturation factor
VCVSRLHRVVELVGSGAAIVEDVDGMRHRVSLLAYDGEAPEPGQWLVVHSGYAIDRARASDAEAVMAELRRGRSMGVSDAVADRPIDGEVGSGAKPVVEEGGDER